MMNELFNFQWIPIKSKIEIVHQELFSEKAWDYLFYRGELNQNEINQIRCIEPCRACYTSWFDIPLTLFDKYKLSDLISSNFITEEQIVKNNLAQISGIGDFKIYKTRLGFSANYARVFCNNCKTNHLLILGLGETQPGLYAGHLQGVWKIA